MSAITFLTTLVQQAITRLNLIETNAKKVDELPHQTTLEPTSKLPVSRGGISEHVTVQQIISSIQNSNYNQLLAVGTITVDGTDITVPSGVSGQINGLLYGTSTDTILSITLCPTGFSRKDIIVLTTANTVVVISGEETDGAIVLAPPVPTDAVYITEFDVNDTSIGTPIDPTLGTQFKKKLESAAYADPILIGSDAVIPLQPNGQSVYAFSNAGLTSIDGFGLDLITGNPSAEVPYPGKDILIYNNKAGNLTLKHDGSGTADVKFLLEGGVDLVIPAGGKVWLKYGPSYCEMIFKSWSDGVGSDILIASANNILNDNTSAGNVARYTFLVPAGTIKKGARLDFWARITKVNNVAVADNFRIYHTNDFSILTQTVVATLSINANLYSPFQRAITFDETTGNMFVFAPSTSQNSDIAASTTAPLEFTFDTEVDNWFSVYMQVNTSNVMNMRDFKVKLTNPL